MYYFCLLSTAYMIYPIPAITENCNSCLVQGFLHHEMLKKAETIGLCFKELIQTIGASVADSFLISLKITMYIAMTKMMNKIIDRPEPIIAHAS